MRGQKSIVILTLSVAMISCGSKDTFIMDARIVPTSEEKPASQQDADRDRAAQRRTTADIRNVGTAMFSWLTDQVGAGAAGQPQTENPDKRVAIGEYTRISHAELEKILVPQYLQALPEKDGWGHPYEFYLNKDHVTEPRVMSIRSPGRDGKYETDDYTASGFDPDQFDEDIVWVDGFFARWPQRPSR